MLVSDYLKEYMSEHVVGRLRNAKPYEQSRGRWHEALKGKTMPGAPRESVDFTTGIIMVARSKSGETRRVPMNDNTVRELLRALPLGGSSWRASIYGRCRS